MKKQTKLILLLIAISLLGFGFWTLKNKNQNSSIPNEKVVREYKANLTINDGSNTFNYDASSYVGKTALDLTLGATEGRVEKTGEGVNAFITAINGRKADDGKHEFWELVINGKSSEVGAGSYTVKEGDQIEWHINNY